MVSEILMDRNVTFCILLHKQFINVIKTFIVCQILTDFCVDNVGNPLPRQAKFREFLI